MTGDVTAIVNADVTAIVTADMAGDVTPIVNADVTAIVTADITGEYRIAVTIPALAGATVTATAVAELRPSIGKRTGPPRSRQRGRKNCPRPSAATKSESESLAKPEFGRCDLASGA
jgi:molybdopterin-binding protein